MHYSLHFYALPEAYVAKIPEEARAARAFIQKQGDKVGAMEFPPGASTLFFVAAEELTGQDLSDLLSGPVGAAEPTDEEVFGGMDRELAERAAGALEAFLSETSETSAGFAKAANQFDFTVGELMVWLKDLHALLVKALDAGGDVATVYG